MKKNLAKKVTLSILAGAVLMSSSVVWAADIINVAPPDTGGKWVSVGSGPYAPAYDNSSAPSASNNKVVFTNGFPETVNVYFAGGYSDSGDVESNTVTISGGEFEIVDIYGGYAKGSGAVGGDTANKGNKVTISGGEFEGTAVYGGVSADGDAKHNEVVISDVVDGSTFDAIYGGFAGGSAIRNTVTISDGTFNASITGGFSVNGNAEGNTVNIGDTADLSSAYLYGGTFAPTYDPSDDNVLNVG